MLTNDRQALEDGDRATIRARFPQLTETQLVDVERRVGELLRQVAVEAGVAEDAAFLMLAGENRLDELAYLSAAADVLAEGGTSIQTGAGGQALEDLIGELVDIGRRGAYVGTPDGVVFDEHHCHLRAREIGAILDRLGGMELMRLVHERVSQELAGTARARELEACWGGVGDWRR